MRHALHAGRLVRGQTSPNPWVGAALVRGQEVIATGATHPAGGPHAEASALLAAGPQAAGADLYVTLEPCAPFPGKRTPSCAERVIAAGIRRVVIAIEDPDPRVRGRGIAMLRNAGIEVVVGDGAAEATDDLRPYIKHRQAGLPYVIAKFAASLDGRTATRTGDSKWITGEAARAWVHQERAQVDAILVGSGTVLADDPALTARSGGNTLPRQPLRVILDSRGRTLPTARILKEPGQTLIATSVAANSDWKRDIAAAGGEILECDQDQRGIALGPLLAELGRRGILSVWAEGGAAVLGSLFDAQVVDEVWAFLAPVLIGSAGRPALDWAGPDVLAEALRLEEVTVTVLAPDVLVRGYTPWWKPA